jgi:hypothetical protein
MPQCFGCGDNYRLEVSKEWMKLSSWWVTDFLLMKCKILTLNSTLVSKVECEMRLTVDGKNE